MKNFTKNAIVVLIFSNCLLSVNSQTAEQKERIKSSYDQRALESLRVKFADEFAKNYAKALEAARINNWPLKIVKENGRVSELQGITDNGKPIYYSTDNAGSAITSRANRLYPGGSLNLSLTGKGMIAGVWDGGVARTDHLDLKSGTLNRVFNMDGSDVEMHATHVTGTIISSGAHSGLNLPGRGIAYEARVLGYNWTNDLSEMAYAASSESLLLSNHSYGIDENDEGLNGAYIGGTRDLDDLIFAAPYYQPVIAAGNSRDDAGINLGKGGHDLLRRYATAKNAIIVAAVLEVPDYTGAGSVQMSSFSSWGPTDDNRVKPDISDKGVAVYSTVNTSTTAYGSEQGTSMASPGVTGTLLLLQQHYSKVYADLAIPYMKSATLRGLMCHTADEAGDYPGPDSKFGWGLINAEKAAQAITKSKANGALIAELVLNQGESQSYTKNITVGNGEPLIATIAWTDKGGVPNSGTVVDVTTPVLVNDLDIRVTKSGGDTYFPWKLNDIVDAPSVTGDNIVDNIEKVQIDNPSGDYTITVTHKGTLVGVNQEFSLIVTGADMVLGTNENDFKVFNVWPNPTNDVLNISLQSDSAEDTFVTLYDIQGKRILNQKLELTDSFIGAQLNLDFLNQGVYLVRIDQGTKQSTKKITIKK